MTIVAPSAAPHGAAGSLAADLRAALAPLLEAAAAGRRRPTLLAVTVPVAPCDPVAAFAAARALGGEPTLWLQPYQRSALLGLGAAWSVRASGAGRFAEVEEAWAELLAGASVADDGLPHDSGPVLLGGFGFSDPPAVSPAWRGFEAASFILPSLLLRVTPTGSWLTASCLAEPDAAAGEIAVSMAAAWGDVAARAAAVALPVGDRDTLRLVASRPDAAEWRESVARLAGAVGRGRLDKAVLARQVDLLASSAIDVPSVLQRLRLSAPESTVFAVSRGARTFLGATPERLVSLRGRAFRSVAMAGSIRRAGDAATDARLAAELLESDKEREEHGVVVDVLRQTLAPLAERLDIAPQPEVVRLRHVQHLVTPVAGRLREPASVLRLVERLHPTPAVGGAPRDLALELIAEEERQERGWYAAPVGWVDRRGDGEFMVALRCGVVEGAAATLVAGCGIVADSDPDREWAESTTKLLALGSALGWVQP